MLENATESNKSILGYMLYKTAEIAKKLDLEKGYRIVINNGENSGLVKRSNSVSFTHAYFRRKTFKLHRS